MIMQYDVGSFRRTGLKILSRLTTTGADRDSTVSFLEENAKLLMSHCVYEQWIPHNSGAEHNLFICCLHW